MDAHDVRLGDLVKQGALMISDGYRVRNEELGRDGIPFVRGRDIGDGWINTDVEDHIRPELLDRVRAKIAEPGDVAFITKGTVGRAGRLRPGQSPVVFAPQVAYWRVLDTDVLDPAFVFYLVCGPQFQAALDGVKTHGAMVADYVSIKQQHDFRVRVPDIDSQRAIAEMLGSLDDKIELNRRMNETLEALAQTLFDRLPDGFWSTMDAVVTLSRASIVPQEFPDERFDHYSIPAYDAGSTPARDLGSEIRSSKFLVASDAVLLSKLNPRFPRVWLPDISNERRSICSTEFLVAVPREPFTREYVYCLMRSPRFQDVLAGLVTGTSGSHQRVKPNDVLAVDVPIPTPAALESFTAAARPILARVALNRRESSTLAELRDALLPKLISGEIRLREAEEAVEGAV